MNDFNVKNSSITTADLKKINTIKFYGNDYQITDTTARAEIGDIAKIVKKLQSMLEQPKMKSISCVHCGAPLEMKFDDHIVKCDYCHSVYAIDTDMIRDVRGE